MQTPYQNRQQRLLHWLAEHTIEGLLVSNQVSIEYLSGFTGSTGYLLVTPSSFELITDGRYLVQAALECPELTVVPVGESGYLDTIANQVHHHQLERLTVEADDLTVSQFHNLENKLGDVPVLEAMSGVVAPLRLLKDDLEIAAIRMAIAVAEKAFIQVTPLVKPGISEVSLAVELEHAMRQLGAERLAFESIIASGPNSAKPHHTPGTRKLQEGDLITIDWGAQVSGYCSDLTRTFQLGHSSKTKEYRARYNLVLEAQARAIAGMKPEITGHEVDALARTFLAEHGYTKEFNHSLGHSLGKEVHDGLGLASAGDLLVLEPGMVLTVEPGIYDEAWGGIRIEDDVLVTATGTEVLSSLPKTWTTLELS
jgi:Xaa-Pro aminopeptidase